jgi:hypothetical protein
VFSIGVAPVPGKIHNLNIRYGGGGSSSASFSMTF